MQTLLSGLSEQASRAYVGASYDDAFSFEWKPAAQFMTDVDLSGAAGSRQRVWLYRAPWAWLADGGTLDVKSALQYWQAEQRAVLQLRRTLRQRLILVNIDRVPTHALFERLGLAYHDEPLFIPADPLAATLAGVFEQMAPECWTLYEALEAAAWLPKGEPEFRSNRTLPTHAGLVELLDLVHAGRQFPNTQLQLHERDQSITSLRHEAQQARAVQENHQNEHEHVLAQLHRAQQALAERDAQSRLFEDQHTSLKQQLAQAISEQRHAVHAEDAARAGFKQLAEENKRLLAQAHQVQEELDQALSVQRQSAIDLAGAVANAKASGEENQLLLSQLHLVQEELEKRHLESQASNDKHAKLKKELDQVLAVQQRSGVDLADAAANAKALSEENQLLLSQLHQVQEALEKRHLETKGSSDKTSKLKKELDQALAVQRQSAIDLAGAAANAKALGEENQRLLSQLHLVREELDQALATQQQSGMDLAGAAANAKVLGEENELLLSQLHLVQEELENYYLANREILAAMDQSNHTLHRARKVISRVAAHV